MDSDLLIRIGAHANVHGVKHTDHDVGKMARMIKAQPQLGEFTSIIAWAAYVAGPRDSRISELTR